MPTKTKTYTATAKVLGKKYTGKGKTVMKALENIKTGAVAGMVIITVSNGKESKDRVIPMVTAKRLFMTVGLTREVALKSISGMFEGL